VQHEPIVITDALAIRWRHSGRLCKKGAAVSASSSGQQSDLKVSIVGATTRPILATPGRPSVADVGPFQRVGDRCAPAGARMGLRLGPVWHRTGCMVGVAQAILIRGLIRGHFRCGAVLLISLHRP
jgi:hypothetical protein